jgi:DNA polymerase-3 subunit delta
VATTLRPDACLKQIAAGEIQPVYFVTGPDHEMKSTIVSALADSLEAELRDFNLDRLHAVEQKPLQREQLWQVLDLARTLPMMAPRRIIVLHGAEKVLSAFKESEGDGGELDAFEAYLKAPQPHATLAFVTAGDTEGNARGVTLLKKLATVVDCDPLSGTGSGEAVAWVKAEAAREGVRIEPAAVRLLAWLAGDDISRLRAEFERALLFASGDGIITEAAVQEVAGAQTTKDVWALNNALQRGEEAVALRELAMKLDAGEFPVMILGQIAAFVRKSMAPQKVKTALDALYRTDLALKTSRGDARVLLERLVVELCG